MLTLYDLVEGEKAYIVKIKGRGQFRQRIMEMGFVTGKQVAVVKKAPLRDPIEYKIMGYDVSLRKSEARLIEVLREKNGKEDNLHDFTELYNDVDIEHRVISKRKNIQVALVGNPNSGKTTLFNFASGSKEKVGNYAGVTVDAKEASYEQSGYTFNIIDLPGTYSIKSYSPEERFVRSYIFENVPDVVINIVDSSNLERNLYLTTQLIDMGIQVVIALNMYDELGKKGDRLDYRLLGKMIGVPVVPTVSSKGKGITELFDKVIEVYEGKEPTVRHIHINYGDAIEEAIQSIQLKIKTEENREFTNVFSARFLAIALLENDSEYMKGISHCANQDEIVDTAKKEAKKLEAQFTENIESEITDLRYGFIAGALKETFTSNPVDERRNSEIIDTFLTHRLFGIPVFIFFMWLMFYSTFTLGSIPKHGIELMIIGISSIVNSILPAGIFRDRQSHERCGGTGRAKIL